ncbi:MAG: hypothetical protein ABFD08_15440 [Syntrophomonas sp.]
MARARNIKPGYFINDDLAALGMAAQLLFAGLWCIADREGRLADRPVRIKAQVMPYYDVDVDELLNKLAEGGFIVRYEIDGCKYIQILKFKEHQNPHKNEAQSVIPPLSVKTPDEHNTSTVQVPEQNNTTPADSLNPITDSLKLIPDNTSPVGEGEDVDEIGGDEGKDFEYPEEFNQFWKLYPRKADKQAAFKKWMARKKEGHLPRDMLKAAINYAEECKKNKTEKNFIKHPKTFLGPDKPFLEFLGKEDELNGDDFKPYRG